MTSVPANLVPVFLATTALEEFWDTTKPIVFLGEWCMLYSRSDIWKNLDYQVLKSPFDYANIGEDSYSEVSDIYEKLLPILALKLNKIHNVNYGERYWRIMIGPWLQWYLPTLYDHYLHIKVALEQFPEFTTIGLNSDSFITPLDTMHFVELRKGDLYNLQLYTRIINFFDKNFPCKSAEYPRVNNSQSKTSYFRVCLDKVFKFIAKKNVSSRSTINLHSSYFTSQVAWKLILKSFGRVVPRSTQLTPTKRFQKDEEKRGLLFGLNMRLNDFELFLSDQISFDIPQCFIEGFSTIDKASKEKYPVILNQIIFSSNSWYFDELFKHWAGCCAENGGLILGTQHGGCYGTLATKLAEDHETEISDYYYSWGWMRSDCRALVIPMPATNFCGVRKIGANNRKNGILWAVTTEPRYMIEFPRLPLHLPEYFQRQACFLNSLSSNLLKDLRFRAHYEEHGWSAIERLKALNQNIVVEPWSVPFLTSLRNCKLYVCDHLSTTYAQALALNIPTILFFYDKQTTLLNSKAKPHFELLKEAGILYDTPEAAAIAVAAAYDNVEQWWNTPEKQKAVEYFCNSYARTSPDSIEKWNAELTRISKVAYNQCSL